MSDKQNRVLVIRHFPKAYSNNKRMAFGFDPPLQSGGRETQLIHSLKDQMEHIDLILTSPYRRTRETARLLKLFYPSAEIRVEPLLSAYLGTQSNYSVEKMIHPSTREHSVPIETSSEQLKQRMEELGWMIGTLEKSNVLVITHSAILEQLILQYLPARDSDPSDSSNNERTKPRCSRAEYGKGVMIIDGILQ